MPTPRVELGRATVRLGHRTCGPVWTSRWPTASSSPCSGPNGTGKTTLLKVLLGLVPLSRRHRAGQRQAARRGAIRTSATSPNNRPSTATCPIRGRDLVRFGVDGHRWGLPLRRARGQSAQVDAMPSRPSAPRPTPMRQSGCLSGGEQQRLRIAQALLGDPKVLLCDEPLLALDLASQRAVTRLIDDRRRSDGTPVLFVTHEINPVLPYVDRILYLVRGRWAIGTPDEILTSERLSDLYGIEVDVVKVRDRYLVVSAEDEMPTEPGAHAHHDHGH